MTPGAARPVMSGGMRPVLTRIVRFAADGPKRLMKLIGWQIQGQEAQAGESAGDVTITNTRQTE